MVLIAEDVTMAFFWSDDNEKKNNVLKIGISHMILLIWWHSFHFKVKSVWTFRVHSIIVRN